MITSAKQYNLNAGQQAAADAFFEFLFSADKEFIISGAAGVGKTYLMEYIIDTTMPRYLESCKLVGIKPEFTEVVMTATTNKAAEVLSRSTRRPTSTVHSFFNLRVFDDFSTGKTVLQKSRNWMVHARKVIFVDECSLVDTELWKVMWEGTQDCKLVYVGDHNQLAPVHEDLSPVYKHGAPMVELTEPVRNAGQPALMEICQQLRDTVSTGTFRPIRLVPGVIDHLNDAQMQAMIDQHFENQNPQARILAFTNRRVVEYNDYIRHLRQLPADFQPGEILVASNALQTRKDYIPVETEVTVLKSHGYETVMVESIKNGDDHDVPMDVIKLDLATELGAHHNGVMVPADHAHYTALIKYYRKKKDYVRASYLKNQFADLRQRDAATVHKSQGSTYDTVFVDLGNISTCNIPNQVARMLYVAFSRARSRIFLYGNLAEKYGGLMLP